MTQLLCVWWVSLLLLPPTGSGPADAEWTQAATPHFTIVTDGDPTDAERLAERFERLHLVFARLWPNARPDRRPVIVIAPWNRARLLSLLPPGRLAPGRAHPSGLMTCGPDRVYVALSRTEPSLFPGGVAVHEYVHVLVEANVPWAPLWLNEGLAEFFAAGRPDEEPAVFGLPNPVHLDLLRHRKWLPLNTLLTAMRGAPEVTDSGTSPLFYAQAWALVHYLKVGDRGRRANQLTSFLAQLARGNAPDGAAADAFGDLAELDRRLHEYVRGETFFDARLPLRSSDPGPKADSARLAEWQAALVLGDFLTHVDYHEEAARFLDRAIALQPSSAEVWERRALLELRRSQLTAALDAADRALALDCRRALSRHLRAVALLGSSRTLTREDTAIAEAELRRAIAAAPNLAPPYSTLGGLLAARDGASAEARALIERAIAIDPSTVGHHVALGQVLLMSGDAAEAQRVAQRARASARTATEREMVEHLLANALTSQPPK